MDISTDRPHSPSARFYANRQSECPEALDTFPHAAHEQQYACQRVPSFNHFQGFSAPPSHQHPRNICAGCQLDERLSPRTTVPYHDHQLQHLPRQQLERFPCENNHMIPTNYGSTQPHTNSLMHTYQDAQNPRRARQLSGPPMTPPPLYFSDPENAPNPLHAERPVSMMFSSQGATAGPLPVPVQHLVHGSNTIRVPSYSPSSDAGQQPQRLINAGHTLTSHEEGQPTSSSDEEDGISTVYPDDSTTTASLSTASPRAHAGDAPPQPLEEAVVEIHNICLAATQRYLESLRVNWELRQGNEIMTQPGQAGPTRRLRDRAFARSSPYLSPRRRRRALSDNSGLELMRGLRGGEYTVVKQEAETRSSQRQGGHIPACPIPAPTNSLVQNTSHICELVWRRACRDRGDVLGAEAAATRKMALLVGCTETVVLYDAAEWEGDPERGFYAACRAGRDFCAELGDLCGAGRVEGIECGETE